MMLICANVSTLFQHLRPGRCSTSFVAAALKDGGFNLLKQMAMALLWLLFDKQAGLDASGWS